MNDLDEKEQNHVRTALRFLRRRLGGIGVTATALRFQPDTIDKVTRGVRAVTPTMALRVARLADVSFDDLVAGRYLPGACPKCGHMPDFADEPTVVEAASSASASGNLSLIK